MAWPSTLPGQNTGNCARPSGFTRGFPRDCGFSERTTGRRASRPTGSDARCRPSASPEPCGSIARLSEERNTPDRRRQQRQASERLAHARPGTDSYDGSAGRYHGVAGLFRFGRLPSPGPSRGETTSNAESAQAILQRGRNNPRLAGGHRVAQHRTPSSRNARKPRRV